MSAHPCKPPGARKLSTFRADRSQATGGPRWPPPFPLFPLWSTSPLRRQLTLAIFGWGGTRRLGKIATALSMGPHPREHQPGCHLILRAVLTRRLGCYKSRVRSHTLAAFPPFPLHPHALSANRLFGQLHSLQTNTRTFTPPTLTNPLTTTRPVHV